jgi:BlaI family transcriptional regulator, penicillinase repressor
MPKNWHIESYAASRDSMDMTPDLNLSRRERQIMDALFAKGQATAAEVREAMPDPPTYTAVRTLLRILEDKGFVRHRGEGRRYVYTPLASTQVEGRSAFRRVLSVFFGGSLEQAVAAHLSDPHIRPTADELQRMRDLIDELDRPATPAKEKGKRRKQS